MIESPAVRVGMNDSDRVCICSSSTHELVVVVVVE
jgi:hypothetical protein